MYSEEAENGATEQENRSHGRVRMRPIISTDIKRNFIFYSHSIPQILIATLVQISVLLHRTLTLLPILLLKTVLRTLIRTLP